MGAAPRLAQRRWGHVRPFSRAAEIPERDGDAPELAWNISNLLQKTIATENCQLLFIGHSLGYRRGCCSKRGGLP
jgi:hypothetical protein